MVIKQQNTRVLLEMLVIRKHFARCPTVKRKSRIWTNQGIKYFFKEAKASVLATKDKLNREVLAATRTTTKKQASHVLTFILTY